MNIEELTVKQICNCIAVINKMTEEKLIKFNPNKACVQFNYDKATRYLEEQNIKQQQQLEAYENMRKEIIEFINLYAGENNNFCLDYHDLMKLRSILNKVGDDNE